MNLSPAGQRVTGSAAAQASFSEALRQHMLRVYNAMGIGLVITGFLAFLVANTPPIAQLIFGTPLQWVVMLAPLGFLFFLNFNLHRASAAKVRTLFYVFCGLMGLSLASVFLVFTGESVARVFFITAATFGGMSLWGYTTRRDLSGMGSFLMMGVIGLVVASLVNIVLAMFGVPSGALQFAISVIGVLVFTGLTAWDTQRIKEEFAENWGVEESGKAAIVGALSLYLNFINLFQFLLQLMGQRQQ